MSPEGEASERRAGWQRVLVQESLPDAVGPAYLPEVAPQSALDLERTNSQDRAPASCARGPKVRAVLARPVAFPVFPPAARTTAPRKGGSDRPLS
jgi:hypothetical protein